MMATLSPRPIPRCVSSAATRSAQAKSSPNVSAEKNQMRSRRVRSPAITQHVLKRFRGRQSLRDLIGRNLGRARCDLSACRGDDGRSRRDTQRGDQVLHRVSFGKDTVVQPHTESLLNAKQQFDALEAAKPQFALEMCSRANRSERRLMPEFGDQRAHNIKEALFVCDRIELSCRSRHKRGGL
jgi:hypothetical protein